MRRFLVVLAIVAGLPGPLMAITGVTPTLAQQNVSDDSLVNVQIGDILSGNNVALGVAAQLVTQLCANVGDVNVAAILAGIADDGNFTGTCTIATNPVQNVPVTITQNPGGAAPPKGNNRRGNVSDDSLVNLQVGDVLSRNNVSAAVAAQLVTQLCANLGDVNVAAIAAGIADDGDFNATCTLTSNPTQSVPVTITQNRGGAAPPKA